MGTPSASRVLLAVEDDPTRAHLAALIASWGYDVLPAATGADASDALRRDDAPRLALLSMGLANPGALAVCRAAREPAEDRLRYVALIGTDGSATSIEAGIEAGADDCLPHPVDPNVLRLRL